MNLALNTRNSKYFQKKTNRTEKMLYRNWRLCSAIKIQKKSCWHGYFCLIFEHDFFVFNLHYQISLSCKPSGDFQNSIKFHAGRAILPPPPMGKTGILLSPYMVNRVKVIPSSSVKVVGWIKSIKTLQEITLFKLYNTGWRGKVSSHYFV